MAREFISCPHLFTGENALSDAASTITSLGNKCFIVTDEMMIKLGNNTLYYFLSHQFILYCIYEIFKRLPLQHYYVGVVCMVAAFFITICSKYIVDWILKHLIRQLRKGEASRE